MDNKRSTIILFALKFLKWLFLIVLILVGSFAIFYGIDMHYMQMDQISKISTYVDSGEIDKLNHLVHKNMVLTQGVFFFCFIISVLCLILIIIFMSTSFLIDKRKLKLKYNHSAQADRAN